MQDIIIARIASAAGISEEMAQTAVKIILNFLAKEADTEKVKEIAGALNAKSMLEEESKSSGGLLGGLMGGMGGAMAAMSELNSAGLGMGEVKSVAEEMITIAKEHVDPATVDEVISSVPGLSQII
nr:DUF2267 domain-containing protein [uncultured Cohaesibacter sp.]